MNLQAVIAGVPALFADLGTEAVQLGNELVTFISMTGLPGFKVATDVLTDIAAGGITPAAALSQLQDVTAFNAAAAAAIKVIKASNTAPVASPAVSDGAFMPQVPK